MGEIRNVGDSVKINEIGKILVNDYTKYEAITWQKLDSGQKILTIDQARVSLLQLMILILHR